MVLYKMSNWDGVGMIVEIRPDHLSTKFETLSSKDKYKYVSGFGEKNGDSEYFNLSFTQEYGGTWEQRLVTFMTNIKEGKFGRLWLIQSEPID